LHCALWFSAPHNNTTIFIQHNINSSQKLLYVILEKLLLSLEKSCSLERPIG
jgi:hypothetical protein